MIDTDFTPVQLEIIGDLGQSYQSDMYFPFAHIGGGFTRKEIQVAMKDLRVREYAEFMRGLMNDEGEVAGSGYALTRKGLDIYDELEAIPVEQRTESSGCFWFNLEDGS